MNRLILVANPGSSSRKYALYDSSGLTLLAELHFEHKNNVIVYTVSAPGREPIEVSTELQDLHDSATSVEQILKDEKILEPDMRIGAVGLRIVAPSAYFMQDHVMTDEVVEKLRSLEHLAPLHVTATLGELSQLKKQFPEATILGVSDSAFHRTKPNYAWNYGINIHDADRLDIKRFGYHGISAQAAVDALWNSGKLPPKVIVCHLGSGSSITGVFHGHSIDTTMGFTPNEGVVMASRSGSISPDATSALQKGLQLDEAGMIRYLNSQAGLKGLGDTDDIRELVKREADGDHAAHLALTTLIHTIHKSIGAMMVAMNGCDALVFTGTVGERSAILRKRIVAHLEFVDFILDGDANEATATPDTLTLISQQAKSRPIFVIPTNEGLEIARRVREGSSKF